jgi:hypothetical protein
VRARGLSRFGNWVETRVLRCGALTAKLLISLWFPDSSVGARGPALDIVGNPTREPRELEMPQKKASERVTDTAVVFGRCGPQRWSTGSDGDRVFLSALAQVALPGPVKVGQVHSVPCSTSIPERVGRTPEASTDPLGPHPVVTP